MNSAYVGIGFELPNPMCVSQDAVVARIGINQLAIFGGLLPEDSSVTDLSYVTTIGTGVPTGATTANPTYSPTQSQGDGSRKDDLFE